MTRRRAVASVAARALAASLLATLTAACGGGGGSVASPATGPWAVLGSSTAAGVGATPGRSWAALLDVDAAARGTSVRNLARAGSVTYQALPSGSPVPPGRPAPDPSINVDAALSPKPSWLLLAFPTNDTVLGYAVAETVANLTAIRERARAQGVAVVVLSTQPRALAADAVARLREIDAAMKVLAGPCFVALHDLLADPSGLAIAPAYSAGDGTHLNDAGHRLVHAELKKTLESGRCVSPPPG